MAAAPRERAAQIASRAPSTARSRDCQRRARHFQRERCSRNTATARRMVKGASRFEQQRPCQPAHAREAPEEKGRGEGRAGKDRSGEREGRRRGSRGPRPANAGRRAGGGPPPGRAGRREKSGPSPGKSSLAMGAPIPKRSAEARPRSVRHRTQLRDGQLSVERRPSMMWPTEKLSGDSPLGHRHGAVDRRPSKAEKLSVPSCRHVPGRG